MQLKQVEEKTKEKQDESEQMERPIIIQNFLLSLHTPHSLPFWFVLFIQFFSWPRIVPVQCALTHWLRQCTIHVSFQKRTNMLLLNCICHPHIETFTSFDFPSIVLWFFVVMFVLLFLPAFVFNFRVFLWNWRPILDFKRNRK